MNFIGGMAALGVPVTWAICLIFFVSASRSIGSFSMSHFRMLFAVGFVAAAQLLSTGVLIPQAIGFHSWILLAASGLAGFFICDALLLQGNVHLGARLGSLVFSFYPFVGAMLAWGILGERMSIYAWIGMAVTMAGIAIVVLKRGDPSQRNEKGCYWRGFLMVCGAAVFQALSFIAAKPVLVEEGGADPLTATFIRAIFGGAAFWLVSIVRGKVPYIIKKVSNVRAIALTAGGTAFGVTGVWLSMVAVKNAPIGIASTLMSLIPVVIIPMTYIINKEKITIRTVIGAAAACIGVAILFLAPS